MKYKLVASDMDGTLLNSEGIITPATYKAVREMEEAGIKFILTTGRPAQSVVPYMEQLELEGTTILYNGAMIANIRTDDIMFEKCVDTDDAYKILELGKILKGNLCIWSKGELFTYSMNHYIELMEDTVNVKAKILEDEKTEREIVERGLTKVLWYNEPEDLQKWLQKEIPEYGFTNLSFCTSMPFYLEMFNKEVSKATAMEELGKIYNIRQEEMIAIGDGLNDIEMIEWAGLGVAMANSRKEVLKIADYTTDTNDNEGFVAMVNKFVLP